MEFLANLQVDGLTMGVFLYVFSAVVFVITSEACKNKKCCTRWGCM